MLPIEKRQIQFNTTSAPNRKIQYLVVHDVGAVSSAEANFNYFNTGDRSSSADFFVDPTHILQTNDYKNKYTWQCGDGHGIYGITNANSLGIEMCLVEPFDTTLKNTIELVKYLMKELNIDINNVVRHYDASHKLCPKSLSDNNWEKWNWFKSQLVSNTEINNEEDDDMSNRLPNYFNAEFYLIANPDVAQAVKEGKMASAEYHYLNFGYVEKRKYCPELPIDYCEGAYLAKNPDVAKAVTDGSFLNGVSHFLVFGWNENRDYRKDEKTIDANKIISEITKVINENIK